MSRSFDPIGGTASITFSPGSAPTKQGPITVAVLAKAANTGGFVGWMARGLNSGTAEWGFLTASALLFSENDFGSGVSGLSTSWRWYVMTKASGSVLPRIHVWDLSTTWAHTNDTSNVGDTAGPIDTVVLGSGSASNNWRGSIAAAATWNSVLSDGTIQTTCTLNASDLLAGGPGWMVRLNQASTGTAVTDDTGNGGNQTALSGTTVDSDEPPGWSYSLTSATLIPTGIAVPVALGQPTLTQGLTLQPSGLAVPAALGNPTLGALTPGPGPAAQTGGSWWQLESVRRTNLQNAEMERRAGPIACPNDGEPLQWDPRSKRRRCPYDGWISPV